MSEPVKIAIVMEGGNLSAVLTAGVPVEYVFIEYADKNDDQEEARQVPQEDGTTAPAFMHTGPAEVCGEFVLRCFDIAAAPTVFRVRLVAAGIQVTATGEDQAQRYVLDDARQFLRDHVYSVDSVEPLTDDQPDDPDDVRIEIGDCEHAGPTRGEGLWTYSANVELVVRAASEADAPEAMRTALEIVTPIIGAEPPPKFEVRGGSRIGVGEVGRFLAGPFDDYDAAETEAERHRAPDYWAAVFQVGADDPAREGPPPEREWVTNPDAGQDDIFPTPRDFSDPHLDRVPE